MSLEDGFLVDLRAELNRARSKFPGNAHMLDACVEEVGEVAAALLQQEGEPHKGVVHEDIWKECVQVAATAVRLAVEGDKSYPKYHPESGYRGRGWEGYRADKETDE